MAKRVLVVSEDLEARTQVTAILRGAGHSVHELPTPIGATRIIAERKVDVLVLDYPEPAVNSAKLARLLWGHRRLSGLSIVLMSEVEHDEVTRTAEDVMAAAVLQKRELPTSLARTVRLL